MISIDDKVKLHQELLDSMHKLYITKNSDYGDSVHDTYMKYGIDSFLVRMTDKLNRVYSLTRKNSVQKVNNEKIEDTLLDLANYSILALIELKEDDNNGSKEE